MANTDGPALSLSVRTGFPAASRVHGWDDLGGQRIARVQHCLCTGMSFFDRAIERAQGCAFPSLEGQSIGSGVDPRSSTQHEASRIKHGDNQARVNLGLERETGFEPATSTLARSHSTAELLPLSIKDLKGLLPRLVRDRPAELPA